MPLAEEMGQIWDEVRKSFRADFPESVIDLWFAPLNYESYVNNVVTLTINSTLRHKIIKEQFVGVIEKGFYDFLGFKVGVDIVLLENEEEKRQLEALQQRFLDPTKVKAAEAVEVGSESLPYRFEYTFDNFIVGNSNKFAHAACYAVAHNPAFTESGENDRDNAYARTYNPLFIYGPSGLGKTHLLHAIFNKIKSELPSAKILYIKCEDFINQLIENITNKTMNEFKEKYRKCDVLLIDDIQFIAGKVSTQEEFFHTFNALYEENKQIILTSDRPPRDIKPLEDRLVTRFEWGLIADIQPPDMELRVAIIKKKAEQAGIELPDSVLEFLAENLRSNIRQIEGAIKKLSAYVFLSEREITLDLAQKCVIELMGDSEPVSVTIDKIFNAVNKKYGVSKDDLLSEKRVKEIAQARHILIYLIRQITDMSYPNIAKLLKKKNHTTIMSSFNIIEERMEKDSAFKLDIENVIKNIKGNQ